MSLVVGEMSPTNTSKQAAVNFFDQAYEILGSVGRGRNSIVYRARSHTNSQDVALKVLIGKAKAPEAVVQRMRREALAMLSCAHPNIVRLLDYVTDGEFCYLAMEFAEQGDLRSLMDLRGKPFEPTLVLEMMTQALHGLERIHRAGIFHRDIKPDNLLLTENYKVKIADFGVAVLPNEELRLESKSNGVGTFDYLAPELLEDGLCNESTDVFSLAITFYELLAGRLPFDGPSFTTKIDAKMRGDVTPLAESIQAEMPGIQDFLERALRAEPNKRYANAGEFLEALELFRKGEWKPELFRERSALTVAPVQSQPEPKQPAPSEQIANDSLSSVPEVTPLVEKQSVSVDAALSFPVRRRVPFAAVMSVFLLLLAPIAMFFLVTNGRSDGFATQPSLNHEEVFSRASADFISREVADAQLANESVANANFEALLDGTHVGRIKGLLPDGQSFSLVATPAKSSAGEDAVLLAVGLSGWTPMLVTANALRNNSELMLASGGIRLALKVEPSNSEGAEEYRLRGTYREHLTGRTGEWVLW